MHFCTFVALCNFMQINSLTPQSVKSAENATH
nr:MAG TPA: hypothetical protein [Caudoviricetes sp.]